MAYINCILICLLIGMVFALGNYLQDQHLETQALILEYQSKLTAVETEKQKTIYEFLDSLNKAGENRNSLDKPKQGEIDG